MAASTSTATDSNNNSCFDVFISHRGPDVKKTFASHMYRRLISYGLRVFLDYEELQEGEDLTCQIKGAIRTASVQIAIFSPTYADSQWCLDELLFMLESGAPIIPVFHHVKPTELRRTQGEGVYATSLRNLEKKRKYDCEPRYDSKTIENWRNALSRVADISGFDLDEGFNGDEGELLDQLVEVVLKKSKKELNVARYPTGLDEKVDEFETKVLLQQHSEKVRFAGITGLGGAGKTTLAKELFNRKSSRYSICCFLSDVRESSKISIPSLHIKLLKDLGASKELIDSKDEGLEILRKHFSVLSAPVLLVLDDVDHQDQVHALLPVTDKGILPLPPSSLILITSRDKTVLARSGVQESSIYKLTGLDTERSRELFCRHAFCQPHPLSGFENLVNQFLKASDGLPLSLKVFGGLFYGNTDKSYWEDELDQLRKTLPSEIQKRLQISYDALQTEEKQIFLDIACFFIGASRDSAIRVWDGSGWKGSRGFQSLLNKCLVEVDIDLNRMEHYIRMHDHLRDMGRDLANSSGFPCRLWRGTKHIEDLLQQSSEATKVRGIRMLRRKQYHQRVHSDDEDDDRVCSDDEDDDRVYSDDDDERASFSRYKMKNLQLLDIDIEEEEDLLKFLLEGGDSPNLLWFRWRNCRCSSLPPYISMEKLRVIEVDGDKLQTLWQEDSQAPLQLRELLIRVTQLFKIPKSIGQLKHLERMVVVSWPHGMIEIPKEFCDLRSLKHLALHVKNNSSLPDSFGNLSTLQHIDLSDCSNLERLPDSFGNLSMLEHINLSRCSGLQRLPYSFGNLLMLEHINLSDCDGLQRLPDSFGNLSRLQHINLSVCEVLDRLPDSFGNLSMLEHIDLSACNALERLPDSFGNLSMLEHINLFRCYALERLPDSFGNLSRLQHINLSSCYDLDRLPDSFGNLSMLEHIDLSGCNALERLPDSFGNLWMLEHIDLSGCNALERLPDSFGNLSMVEHIDLSGCNALERLPDSFGNLSMLEHIDLSGCNALERLPDSFGNLIKLKYLCLSGCDKLTIPGGTFLKITLEDMTLPQWRMEVLPPQVVHLLSLKKVLLGFINLIEWPGAIGESSHVEKLVLETPFLETLPPSFGRDLRNLKSLELRSCRSLKRLPDSFFLLNQLIELTVEDCSLRELHVKAVEGESKTLTDSGGQKTLSNFESCLHRLQYLKMHKTQISEISLPTSVCPHLQHLEIRECRDLVEVGTLPDALINLQLTGCPKLKTIERLCGFPKLQTLDGSLCKEGEELPLMEDKSRALTEWRGQRALSDLDSSFDIYLLRLQHLELHSTSISEVSFPTGVCPNLQRLHVRECRDLVEVGTLPDALINLQLTGCPKLRKIERLCGFPKFQTLDVSLCKEDERGTLTESRGKRALGNLDFSFDKYLLRLQHLELHDIAISEVSFPTGVCPNLQHLDIRECRHLVDVGTLPDALINLQLAGCPQLKKIERLFAFTELQPLYRRVHRTFSNLDPLFDKSMLSLCNTEISEVSFPKGVYPNIQYLSVKHGKSTVEFGKSPNGEFMKLEVLNCCKLRKIEELCGLAKLQILDISSCEGVELSSKESLEKLQVLGCPNLKSIHGLAHLTHLRELNVSGCSELEELPGLDNLTSLEMLLVGECVKLESIQGLARLTQLRELSVSGCSELQELPGLEHLTSLKKLSADKCVKLKNIKGLEQLTQLLELNVSGCFELEEMPGVGYLQSLVELRVSDCVKLKTLWGLSRLTNLSVLEHTGVPMRVFGFDSMS